MPRRDIVLIELVGWEPAQAEKLHENIVKHLQNKGFGGVFNFKVDENKVVNSNGHHYPFVRIWCNTLLTEAMAEVEEVLKNKIEWNTPFDIHVVNLTQFIRAEARLGPPK